MKLRQSCRNVTRCVINTHNQGTSLSNRNDNSCRAGAHRTLTLSGTRRRPSLASRQKRRVSNAPSPRLIPAGSISTPGVPPRPIIGRRLAREYTGRVSCGRQSSARGSPRCPSPPHDRGAPCSPPRPVGIPSRFRGYARDVEGIEGIGRRRRCRYRAVGRLLRGRVWASAGAGGRNSRGSSADRDEALVGSRQSGLRAWARGLRDGRVIFQVRQRRREEGRGGKENDETSVRTCWNSPQQKEPWYLLPCAHGARQPIS